MPDLALNDVTLHYETEGSGPAMVLISGMMSDSASWHILMRALTRHFTVIRLDNRTTGRTTPWDAPVSVQHFVDDILALMDHLGHDRAHLVGHSMGGLTALELAARAPQKALSVIAMTAPLVTDARMFAVFDGILKLRQQASDPATWLHAFYPWIFRPGFFENPANVEVAIGAALAYPHAQSPQAMAHQMSALKAYRPTDQIARITAPTLALYAGHDLLVNETSNRAAFARIPQIAQRIIADAGHSIHWDAPDAVAAQIIEFASTHNP